MKLKWPWSAGSGRDAARLESKHTPAFVALHMQGEASLDAARLCGPGARGLHEEPGRASRRAADRRDGRRGAVAAL